LTSNRITNSAPVSHFHILPRPAHTLLSRACLSVLFQLDHAADRTNTQDFPLAQYAAEHWVDHARFEDISMDIQDGMDRLFDRDKPHFAAWVQVHDMDGYNNWNNGHEDGSGDGFGIGDITPTYPKQPYAVAAPLYYAALCGIRDLAERLLAAHPQDLNAQGGVGGAPLNAALHSGCLNIVLLLLEHGADGENGGKACQTALYLALSCGYTGVVRTLIDHNADLIAQCDDWDDHRKEMVKWTPLHVASKNGRLEIARILLENGADVNYQGDRCRSPLNIASRCGYADFVRLLLNHGADLNASDERGQAALHKAAFTGQNLIVKLLLGRGANVDSPYMGGWTPLLFAAKAGHLEVVQLLLNHGADVKVQYEEERYKLWITLHIAIWNEHPQVVKALLEHGADPHARTRKEQTPFQLAKSSPWGSEVIHMQIMQLILERTRESG